MSNGVVEFTHEELSLMLFALEGERVAKAAPDERAVCSP